LFSVAVPITVLPLRKFTVPVGWPEMLGFTEAVRVRVEVLGEKLYVRVVEVGCRATVRDTLPVLGK